MSNHLFHTQSFEKTAASLEVDLALGLNEKESENRLDKFGPNEIRTEASVGPLKILVHQFANPMTLLLCAVAIISLLIKHQTDFFIISGIIILNSAIGFFQELKAEKAMESIRQMTRPEARVLRSGEIKKIKAKEMVPGDLVVLEAGDRIPADIRFCESANLLVDESLLTGESQAIYKNTDSIEEKDIPLGDKANMGFMGTHVVSGRGIGICVGTGLQTELGKIAHLVSSEKSGEVPLKKRMNELTRYLVLAAFVLCLLVFGIGALYHDSLIELFLSSISLAVAALPEGLPAVITISLSLGALALSKKGVLIRKLQAVEALGSITTICTDKTGTLTQNKMTVTTLYLDNSIFNTDEEAFKKCPNLPPLFFETIILCNDATALEDGSLSGDPMETGLLEFCTKNGYNFNETRKKFPRISEIPFDSQRKRMTTLNEINGIKIALSKGAPESIISVCTKEISPKGPVLFEKKRMGELHAVVEKMAGMGLRILALAFKDISSSDTLNNTENEMIFLGLIGIQDPPRKEAKMAIAECLQAGIRPVMITGDHPQTAISIGRNLGIYKDGDATLTGHQIAKGGRELIEKNVLHTTIYARVSPEDKLTIVEALQQKQEIVAMTGDGVNDAPALKKADIGIAMGRGTDVAKEASSIVLVKENFSSIVSAIAEGRLIYDNIRKFVRYMLTTNFGEIATMLLATIFFLPLPLLPVQILWINLVTDGLPAIALGFEKAEGDLMKKPPRNPRESILSGGLWQHVLWVGMLMGFITTILVFILESLKTPIEVSRTMAFTTMVTCQMGHVLGIKTQSRSFFKTPFLSNYRLMIAVLLTLFSQVLLVYISPFQMIFNTVPLTAIQFLLCMGLGALVLIAVEIEKLLRNKKRLTK